MRDQILLIISVVLMALGSLWLRNLSRAGRRTPGKLNRRSNIIAVLIASAGGFIFLTSLINMLFGPAQGGFGDLSISPERVDIFGISVGITIVYTWVIMAILIVAAIIIRLAVFTNPKSVPSGAQNVIETIVDIVGSYTNAQAHGTGEMLCSYILSIGSLMVMCAFFELFRLRAPTSDISMTFALAFMSFILINVYGIKRKGIRGRIKSLASPTPIVFPFRVITEIALPVSMACRLFGNMLGGFIVLDLLYGALGNYAVGIPGVLGLYFNAFHPLLQTFIFVTLTLSFINEAIENVS